MEYIQCTHCNKKYGINDKVRAAVGRNIACKGCGESFEIVIFETPTPSTPQESQASATEQTPPADTKTPDTRKSEAETQENNIQEEHAETQQTGARKRRVRIVPEHKEKKFFSPSMLLGVAIIALSGYIFYQDRNIDIGKPFVATEMPRPSAKVSEKVTLEQDSQEPAIKKKAFAYEKLSEACKSIAAQQWVMDYTMMHGMPEKSEYTRMLDESVQNTAEIRKKCGSSSIVQKVLATATKGTPPKWLEKHVSALITLGKETPHF